MKRTPVIDACPLSRTLAVIGDTWVLLILRDLFNGKSRFSEFAQSLEGVSSSVLSGRLKHLEDAGLVVREVYSQRPLRAGYQLTEKGRALGPILREMKGWGLQHTQSKASKSAAAERSDAP